MGPLKVILLFVYMLAALLGVAGITISLLSKRRNTSSLNNSIVIFLFGMLLMCFYDWFIYFENYSFFNVSSTLALRIGSCVIAVLFSTWVDLEHNMLKPDSLDRVRSLFKIYSIGYAIGWLIISIFFKGEIFYTIKFLLLFTDIVLLIVVILLSVVYMSKLIIDGKRFEPAYMVIVTSMLVWNYVSFIWGEMSVYWGNSAFIREPLDFTIIFWLVVNIATIRFVYEVDFSKTYSGAIAATGFAFDLETRLSEMEAEYHMTSREIDILRLIYHGMSNMEIAEQLFISKSTVKSHIYNTFRKANVKSRSEMIRLIYDPNYKPID